MQKSIFLTGLLSARVGGLEVGNLGNFAIIDPFIDNLKEQFPGYSVRTSFQLTEPYEKMKGITCLRDDRFWNYGFYTAKKTIKDLGRLFLYKLTKKKSLLQNSLLLKEIDDAEFVIDFSGDVFGENAKFNVFLEGAAKFYFALALKKKVFVLASSPGPFTTLYKKVIVKYLYNRATRILNREPLSTDLLHNMGFSKELVDTSACPSYLFKGHEPSTEKQLLKESGIEEGDKVIGFIITGWTMPKAPYNKIPRDVDELTVFIDYVKFLYEQFDGKILLMSHANRTDDKGNMDFGNDYYISKQLYELLPKEMHDRVLLLDTILDARRSKALIGNFDLLVSGRLHAAIAGISQCVPTIVLDYGHEPKAHKLRGFLRLINHERFLCDPNDLNGMKKLATQLWDNQDEVRKEIKSEVEKVRVRAMRNFKEIKNYL